MIDGIVLALGSVVMGIVAVVDRALADALVPLFFAFTAVMILVHNGRRSRKGDDA